MKNDKVISLRITQDEFSRLSRMSNVSLGVTLRGLLRYFLSLEDELKKEILKDSFLQK